MRVFRVGQFVGQAGFVHMVSHNAVAVGGIFRQAIVIDFHAELLVDTHRNPCVLLADCCLPALDRCKSETLPFLIYPFHGFCGHLWHICEDEVPLRSVAMMETAASVMFMPGATGKVRILPEGRKWREGEDGTVIAFYGGVFCRCLR